MVFVSRRSIVEVDTHKFAAEASALGFAPGEWPKKMETDAGNRMPFVQASSLPDGGVRYKQVAGCITLDVLND